MQCAADDDSTSNASDHFRQTADIDASATASWNNGSGFEPIASITDVDSTFSGVYDGNGYSISNLTINRTDQSYVGLFGYLFDGKLTDITLRNTTVEGKGYVGALVAHGNGEIRNVTVDASVTAAEDNAGGIVSRLYENTTVADVSASVSILNPGGATGGLVGAGNMTISRAAVDGSITASSYVGGAVGSLQNGRLEQLNSSVAVNGVDNIGGVVGAAITTKTISIRDTYARGSVDGSTDVGGFAGEVAARTTMSQNGSISVSNTYATGEVTGSTNVAGHTGLLTAETNATLTVSTSYFDWEATTRASAVGSGPTDGFTALSTAELTGSAAETNLNGFDFEDVWSITPDSYPILRHERLVADSLSVALDDATLTSGETTSATVMATDLQGQTSDVTDAAQLGSTNTSVVTVTSDGTVTAVGEGQANVTAAHGGKTAETPVTVTTDDIAAIPETYNGTITIEGNPAPNGTVIEARIDGEVRGTVTISEPGSYGSTDPFATQLSVNGSESEAGSTVSFYLRPPESLNLIAGAANETSPFQPNNHTVLESLADLETPLPQSTRER
ncbi:MAG: hypothetical protein U5K37_08460 [Natrialbaceae archaeon]|nr:hypothetical protein [Natrialbaceae archaeon]